MSHYPTGLLIIRAWLDKASANPLRAHIRATNDVSKGFASEQTFIDVASTNAAVQTWLESIFGDEGPASAENPTESVKTWELQDLNGLPVISIPEAKEIGHVAEGLFDPSVNALFGIVVTPTEKSAPLLLIRLSGILSIGKDAITVESLKLVELFEDNSEARRISAAGGYRNGMNVITESGESVGKIDKIILNEDGSVASYRSSNGLFGFRYVIEPSEVKLGSNDTLVISDNAGKGTVKNDPD